MLTLLLIAPEKRLRSLDIYGRIIVFYLVAQDQLNLPFDVAWELGSVQEAMEGAVIRLAVTVAAVIGMSIVMGKYMPTARVSSFLVFNVASDGASEVSAEPHLGAEAPGGSLPEDFGELLGERGTAESVLRPTGVVSFGHRRVHVLTDGQFLQKGTLVEVIEVEGHRVVVKSVEEAKT